MKILVVDDDATTRARLAFLLRRNGFEVSLAEDGEAAWKILDQTHFPMILTDWAMPKVDGVTLCSRLRAAKFPDYIYVILLTGHSEKSEVTRGLEAGADDYITKPFDSGELLARLRVGLRILSMQAHMQAQKRQLEELASLDGLTGVLNRRALEARLDEASAHARRRMHPLSVALLDLDRFKNINDTYGHQAGDHVLQTVAARVKSVIREYDSIGRYGGEEFLVLLNDATARDAKVAAERIRSRIAAGPVDFEGQSIPVTASIGVAACEAPRHQSVRDLVALADGGLYEAKRSGRNCVVVRTANDARNIGLDTPDLTAEVG